MRVAALDSWAGKDYRSIRGGARVVAELPFTTERKYMATVVDCSDGIRRMYIKGAPEIVLGLSSVSGKAEADIYDELSGFQQKAMRTLGFACAELAGNDLNFDFSGPVSGLHSESVSRNCGHIRSGKARCP